jgi:hypothetical protein
MISFNFSFLLELIMAASHFRIPTDHTIEEMLRISYVSHHGRLPSDVLLKKRVSLMKESFRRLALIASQPYVPPFVYQAVRNVD